MLFFPRLGHSCKHVQGVLFRIEACVAGGFTNNNLDEGEDAPTSKLCEWNVPRKKVRVARPPSLGRGFEQNTDFLVRPEIAQRPKSEKSVPTMDSGTHRQLDPPEISGPTFRIR